MSSNKKTTHGTFDKDMHDFLIDMEVSAKRIIKKSNKKRMEETQRQRHQLQRKKLGLGTVRTSSAPGMEKANLQAQSTVLLGFPEKPQDSGTLQPSASMGTLDYGGKLPMPTSPIQSPLKPRHGMHSPLPELHQLSTSSYGGKQMRSGGNLIGSSSLNALPSIHSATPSKAKASVVKKPINKKLAESPLFSNSMMSLLDNESTYSKRNRITPVKRRPRSRGANKAQASSMSMGSLTLGKGDASVQTSPSKFVGGGSIMEASSMSMLGLDKFQALHAEDQGPISWSLDDLRIKYRGEVERETAYSAFKAQKAVADQVWRDEGTVLAVAEVERHPIYAKLWAWLELENVRSANRARARNKMKRFVHDVHQIWMTNLQHLKEYRVDKITQLRLAKAGGRRDVKAILHQNSQIQSIAPEEAVRDFIFEVESQGTEDPATNLTAESGLDSLFSVRSAEELAPELPPPHEPAPQLKPLVESLELDLQSQSGGRLQHRRLLVYRLALSQADQEQENEAKSSSKKEEESALKRMPSDVTSDAGGNTKEPEQELMHEFPKWRITAYDPDSGRESTVVLYEADALESVNKILSTAPEPKFTNLYRRSVRIPVGEGVFTEPCLMEIAVGEGTHPPSTQKRGWEMAMPPPAAVAIKVYPTVHPQGRPLRVKLTSDEIWFRLKGEAYEAGHPPYGLEFWQSPERAEPDGTWERLTKKLVLKRSGDWELDLSMRCPVPDVWDDTPKAVLAAKARALLSFLRLEDVPRATSADQTDAGTLEFPALKIEHRHSINTRTAGDRRLSKAGSQRRISTAGSQRRISTAGSQRRISTAGPPQRRTSRMSSLESDGSLTSRTSTGRQPRPGSIQTHRDQSISLQLLDTDNGAEWESWADKVLPLSIQVCGKIDNLRVVPGLTAIGRPGLWRLPPGGMPEFTRAAGFFFRDPVLSSTDSVLANVVLALDTPEITPMLCAWDPYNQLPESPPEEDPPEFFIPLSSEPLTLLQQPVQSELDTRISCTIYLLSEAETAVDFQYTDKEMCEHRRGWTERNPNFFRQKQTYWLTIPNPEFANIIFGITRKSAVGNSTGVTGRSIWHSEQRSLEQLVKKRAPKDYAYVTKNEIHHGFFDPNMYHVYLDHEQCREIWKGGLTAWKEEVRRLQEEKIKEEKAKALAAKIEAGQDKLEAKRLRHIMMAKKQKLKEFKRAAKAQGKSKAARIQHQWKKRYERSELLATRNDWEMRRDLKTGQFFYHCLDEFVPNPDQWDPPNGWEDTPNESLLAEGTQQAAAVTAEGLTLGDTALEELGDTYYNTQGTEHMQSATGEEPVEASTQKPEPAADMEVLVDELAGNTKLVEALAKKLGIPEGSLKSQETGGDNAPRREREGSDVTETEENIHKTELDSDDDPWSDLDDDFGNYSDDDLQDLDLPQDHTDNWSIHVKDRIERRGKVHKPPSQVPDLDLVKRMGLKDKDTSYAGHVDGKGWRRLPKAHIAKTFYQKATQAHTSGPIENAFVGNTSNEVFMVGLMDPADVVDYDSSKFTIKSETMFVDNIIDVLTNLKEAARLRLKKEELLSEDISLAELLGNKESDKLTSEKVVIRDPEEEAIDIEDKLPELEHRAILATKNSNKEGLELALDEGAPIESSDNMGNTLFILAAQQGNKSIVKFLLRRGAMMNVQNINGNTALHYCFEYQHIDLAEYLKKKGCDDTILNAQGMTCYEGLRKEELENL